MINRNAYFCVFTRLFVQLLTFLAFWVDSRARL